MQENLIVIEPKKIYSCFRVKRRRKKSSCRRGEEES
jgi:hypothetical protein